MGRPSLILLLGILAARPAAADCVDYRDYWHWAGEAQLTGSPWSQVVDNGLAYITTRSTGVSIVDVTDPSTAAVVGTSDTPGSAWGIRKVGQYLLVGDDTNGLLTVDVSNPAAPAIVNTWDPGNIRSVFVSGNTACAAGGGSFYILDITNPAAPSVIGSTTGSGAATYDIDVNGNRAFLASSDGLHIIDISDPVHPAQIGFLAKYGSGSGGDYAVYVRGNYAYVIEPAIYFEYGALRVVNISNPAMPVVVHDEAYYGGALDVIPDGSRIVVAGYNTISYDLTDPALPTPVDVLSRERGFGLTVSNGHLYFLLYALEIFDISGDPLPPSTPSPNELGGRDIAISGNYAYSTRYAFGSYSLDILNISNPAGPVAAGSISLPGGAGPVATQGNYLYVASGGLKIYDITSPGSPAARGTLGSIPIKDMEVNGSFLYAVADNVLSVVNVANPMAPTLVRQLSLYGWVWGADLSGSRLYVAEDDYGVEIYDVSVPDTPVLVGTIDTPQYAEGVEASGSILYVGDDTSTRIYDVTNPAAATLLSSLPTPGPGSGLLHQGDFLYVSDWYEGLEVIDVSDPSSPRYVGSHRSVGGGNIAGAGDYLYVCDGYHGLAIISQQCEITSGVQPAEPAASAFRVGAPWPNPASASVRIDYETPRGFSMPAIEIFNVSGQIIRRLGGGSDTETHTGTVSWDGTDESGLPAPAGVYFIRFQAGHQTAVRRVVRVD